MWFDILIRYSSFLRVQGFTSFLSQKERCVFFWNPIQWLWMTFFLHFLDFRTLFQIILSLTVWKIIIIIMTGKPEYQKETHGPWWMNVCLVNVCWCVTSRIFWFWPSSKNIRALPDMPWARPKSQSGKTPVNRANTINHWATQSSPNKMSILFSSNVSLQACCL